MLVCASLRHERMQFRPQQQGSCRLRQSRRRVVAPSAAAQEQQQEEQQVRQLLPGPLAAAAQQAARAAAVAAAAASLALTALTAPAGAVLSSPSMLIPRSAEVALRRAVPAFNADVQGVQRRLEAIQSSLRIPSRKPWTRMNEDAGAAGAAAADRQAMLVGVLPGDRPAAEAILDQLQVQLQRLAAATEVKDPARTSVRTANALELVSQLELLQAPGLPYQLPAAQQAAGRPVLTGRAVVEVVFEAGDGRRAFSDPNSDSGPQSRATLRLVLDGFSAPLTAGNFAAAVADGLYNNQLLQTNSVAVLAGGAAGGAAAPLPLEMLARGDFEPQYRLPLEVGAGERPVLPLSIFGALAMAHLPSDPDGTSGLVSSRQFFIYEFDRSSSGLAGLDYDEGTYPVFGYAVKGLSALPKLQTGDRIVSARLVEGADKLVRPSTPAAAAAAEEAAGDAAAAAAAGGGGEQ